MANQTPYTTFEHAAQVAKNLLATGHWVDLSHQPDGSFILRYGTIHTNGTWEQAIGVQRFHANGAVTKTVCV